MNIAALLEIAAETMPDRVAIGPRNGGTTFGALARRARRIAAFFDSLPTGNVVLLDANSEAVHLALFGSALSGRPLVPLSYRLEDAQLRALARRVAPAIVVVGPGMGERIDGIAGLTLVERAEILAVAGTGDDAWEADVGEGEDIAVMLFTSGTTGEPKAAVLRHRNLSSYVLSTVECMGADEDEAALVSVPPYHIAAISAALTGTFAGRRSVLLESFDATEWVATARREQITHAMVVPTMLSRILDEVASVGGIPSLRHLSYGGGPMPAVVVERALRLLPEVGFVNAYGLTETSSTISVLGPDDHRAALAGTDADIRARLGSVGRPLPTIEVSIRDECGTEVDTGEVGEIWVRGEQVSGEYVGVPDRTVDGWFPTRDEGRLDADGYLFINGRLDDVIVRGGENLSPGEIEAVLATHPAVEHAAVVGIPDDEWGERVVAAVVVESGSVVTESELKEHVRARLRSTKTPDRIEIVDELPFNETGKLLRRVLRTRLTPLAR